MSTNSTNPFSLARSKLHLSVGGKDSVSLHRWVLLKNSILRTLPSAPQGEPDVGTSTASTSDNDNLDDEVGVDVEESFVFPDAGVFLDTASSDAKASDESEWLDSLLETLGDQDDDFVGESDARSVNDDGDDDEDQMLSPLPSPMSSSDDLANQAYYLPPIYPPIDAVPYSAPFFPNHTPLIHSYPFDCAYDSHYYDDPLPYHDEDVEDLSMPDAIEDTSDDESDAPPTPSLGRSSTSICVIEPALIPLPAERSRLGHGEPQVYVESDDSYFFPFEVDPLPFPQDHHPSYNTYQEC